MHRPRAGSPGPACVPLQGRAEEEDAGWGAQEPGPFLPAFLLQTEGLGRTARERPAQAGGWSAGLAQPAASSLLWGESHVSATLLGPNARISPECWELVRTWQVPPSPRSSPHALHPGC